MPIVYCNKINEDITIVIWNISETSEELISLLPKKKKPEVESIHLEKRKLEFAAVRLCLLHLIDDIEISYSSSGKPSLKNAFLGISHTKNYASIILSKKRNVAIDIEIACDRVLKLREKFLSKDEILLTCNDIIKTTLLWCCKESLYKLHGNGQIDFIKDIHVSLNQNEKPEGVIKDMNNIQMEYEFFDKFDQLVMVWAAD